MEFKWAEALCFMSTDPCVRMNSNSKSVNSAAIKAEIKRHESLQRAMSRLSKQFERVEDQQLCSGLKVYLHSVQGKLVTLSCHVFTLRTLQIASHNLMHDLTLGCVDAL